VRWTALVVVVLLAATLGGLWYVTDNRPSYAGMTLRLATGNPDGVYYPLGVGLRTVWDAQLGVNVNVLKTSGSVANVGLLRTNGADVAISAADAADTGYASFPGLRALGRLYDDYVQVVVRADEPIAKFGDLRGHTVSMGAPGSGVALISQRLLAAAGMSPQDVVNNQSLGLDGAISALLRGRIDALVWSGGLPTPGLTTKAAEGKLRILDLSDLIGPIQAGNPNIYAKGEIPDSVYGMTGPPPTTLVVPDLLLVTDRLPDNVAQALLGAVFSGQAQLIQASQTARSIDVQQAIYTEPIPLHDGAVAYYRSAKF
jgi:hypothetical protein